MRLPRMSTRWWLGLIVIVALGLWLGAAAVRVADDFQNRWVYHLWERDGLEEHRSVFLTEHPAPYWPRFLAKLFGRAWPGGYVCPRCAKEHERYARIVKTSFSPDHAAYTDPILVASGRLPPRPLKALYQDYFEGAEARRHGPLSRVVIEAVASGPAGAKFDAGDGRTRLVFPGRVTYVVKVSNPGSEAVTGVAVTATLSGNTALTSIGTPDGAAAVVRPDGILILPEIERLEPGGSTEFQVNARATGAGVATCRVSVVYRGTEHHHEPARADPD